MLIVKCLQDKLHMLLEEVHRIKISHRTIANYALTAAAVIKPFVNTFDYKPY